MSEEEFEKHFSPPYNPWQQRLCLAPASDFFGAIRDCLLKALEWTFLASATCFVQCVTTFCHHK